MTGRKWSRFGTRNEPTASTTGTVRALTSTNSGKEPRIPVDAPAPLSAPFRTGSYLIRDFDPKGGKGGRYFRKGSDLQTVPFRASGSRQLDKPRFRSTLQEIATLVPEGGRIYLVDLREESHLFFDDSAVSWYAEKDFANVGQPLTWIRADERAQIEKIKQVPTTQVFSIVKDDQHRVTPTGSVDLTVGSAETEEQFAAGLVVGRAVEYVRLPVTDHWMPRGETLVRFIDLCERIVGDKDWVHFHCRGGSGRTAMFLALYDMLSWARSGASDFPSLEEFARRQRELFPYCLNPEGCGGSDVAVTDATVRSAQDWKYVLGLARWRFLAAWHDSVRYRLGPYAPLGSYRDSTTDVRVTLSARCRTRTGAYTDSKLDITLLRAVDIGNVGGVLTPGATPPSLEALARYEADKRRRGLGDFVPSGSFLESADEIGVVLSGNCKRNNNDGVPSTLDVSALALPTTYVENIDGVLTLRTGL